MATTRSSVALATRQCSTQLREGLNKVPEVTLYFWIIKVLCTTVGETASDYLSTNLNLGLTNTTLITGSLLLALLVVQFRAKRYVPSIYWLGVVLISVVGTQITDNLTDNFGVSLVTTTTVFSITLATVFAIWYGVERTLSIHTIKTTRRELFYWLTILFTFALGTAAGDLTAERLSVGYWNSALIFGGAICFVFLLHRLFGLNAILSFWIAYVLTRPLGASLGDGLSQARSAGGLALGTTVTSGIFLGAIVLTVAYLTLSRKDRIGRNLDSALSQGEQTRILVVANKTAATATLVDAVRKRAARGAARFVLLVPNPDHLVFDRNSRDIRHGEQVLALALPLLEEAAGAHVEGLVAASPNAYDDIVAELAANEYQEIILSTLPGHVSHWLHLDLPRRVAQLGYPVTTVTPRTPLRRAPRRDRKTAAQYA